MSIIDKVCGKLGLMDEPEEKEDALLKEEMRKNFDDFKSKRPLAQAGNVVNLHTAANTTNTTNVQAVKPMKVMVLEPLSFDDAQHIADHLKNKKPVVINFENTDTDIAKRIIDFVSGTTYALSGNIQKVGNNIFLCAPNNVDVAFSPDDTALSEKVVMPWLKK